MPPGAKPFVGRDRELTALEEGLESARAGKGCVFVLAGEPGIGKTRLADELAAKAARRGARVLWGRCWETGPAPAYWPWTQVLRELAAAQEPGLAPILEGAAPTAPASTPEVESARFRLHDAAFRALKAETQTSPLVIILDDLHAADADSLSLLLFVARNARTLKLLLVCTTREAEVAAKPALESQLMRVGREGTRLALKRLSQEDVAQLIRALSGAAVSDDAIAAVFRTTDGTPLYVDEAVRLLEARGPEAVSRLSTEATAREVLNAHLALLPAEAHAALRAAAVIGRDFSLHLLAKALDTSEMDAAKAVAAAEKARVVAPAGPSRFRFAHVLLQEALYESTPEPQRLHERVARVLEANPTEAPLSMAAHHALRALPHADSAWAIALATRAAEDAKARLAFDAAADLYLRARKSPGLPAEQTLDLLLAEADCRLRLGAGAEGRQLALEAVALARAHDDAVHFARAALTLGGEFQIGVVSAELIALLDEAQKRLAGSEHKALLAQLLARQAAAMQPSADPSVPVRMAHQALKLARELEDPRALQATLYSVCSAFGDYEEPDIRAPLNRELVDLAQKHGDRVLAHRGLTRLAVDLVEMGRLKDCELLLVELEALAKSSGVPQVQWRVPLVRSMLAAAEGRFETCDALLEEARALGAGLDDWNVRMVCLFHAFALGVVSERPVPDGLVAAVMSMMPGAGEEFIAYGLTIQAAMTARDGDAAATRALIDRISPRMKLWNNDPTSSLWMAGPVRVCGLSDIAASLGHSLRSRRFEYGSWGAMGLIFIGPLAGVHGLLEAAQHHLATAEKLQVESVEKLRALGANGLLARALFELARTRVEMGDRAGALGLLDEAHALAESLHQSQLVPQIVALRGEAPAAPRPAATAPVPEAAFSLAKEGDTWAVRHAGKTFHLRDTRGLHMLETLLGSPGQEFHALDLSGSHGEGAVDSGDAGELLDDTAKARYRSRAADLREQLEEAEGNNDKGRIARVRAELEFLEDELKRAFGLSGKARRSASAAERARVNVQRRIKEVLKKIEENDSVLGQHLAWAVKTGTFCSYKKS